MVAGQVDFACISLTAVISQIQAGTIKAMAIASSERSNVINDLPTTKEGGLSEFQVSGWNAIFGPKNLPQSIQGKLNEALAKALDDETISKRLLQMGSEVPDKADRTPDALQRFVEKEVARWLLVLKGAATTPN
jgi:tripartite-type tricarboxylate transporter receptor subunit TctC